MAFESLFGGGSNVQAPDYSQAINTIQQAGQTAADMGVFRPVTISNAFGTPTYTYDGNRLTGATVTPSAWMQQAQEKAQAYGTRYQDYANAMAADTQALQAANQAYGRGADIYGRAMSALPESYDTAAKTQEYYDRMQQMVAPQREQQLASTRNNLFQKGRQGLAVGATQAGGQAATNPEMAAYYNAVAQQDLGLANQAEQQALANLAQQQNMAAGLFGLGMQQTGQGADLTNAQYRNLLASQQPLNAAYQQANALNQMTLQPLELGLQFGTPTTQGMQYGGSMLYNAGSQAAGYQAQQAQAAAAAANANQQPGFWDALGGSLISTGLNAGLGMGMNSLFSGANTMGGVNNLGSRQFATAWDQAWS